MLVIGAFKLKKNEYHFECMKIQVVKRNFKSWKTV